MRSITASVTCKVRRNGQKIVLHVINRDYDAKRRTMREAKDVRIAMLATLARSGRKARLLSYEGEPATVPVRLEKDTASVSLPRLHVWTLVALE